MKNKKSVLIIIFSLLLTLAFPVRANAEDTFVVYCYQDTFIYQQYYYNWNDGATILNRSFAILDCINAIYSVSPYPTKIVFVLDGFDTGHIYDDVRSIVYHNINDNPLYIYFRDYGFTSINRDIVFVEDSDSPTFSFWFNYYKSAIDSYGVNIGLDSLGLYNFYTNRPMYSPTPSPIYVPDVTPIPTYNPYPTARPTYTPVPLPTSEPLPINDYYLWGNSGGSLGCGSSLPSSYVWATSFSTTLTLNSTFNIPLPNGITLKSSRTDFGILEIGAYTVFTNVFTTYGSSSTTGNLPCIVRSSDYVENLWIGSWTGSVVSPSPMPTYTPVPLPPISTPIPTFNPNAPINPDFNYNLGQSVEFGQLPILFSNVSELSYLFVTPFEFLVTNMWERWYILFLFPIVAIISAFIWERRN